jgi:hypothetical protein
MRLRGSSTKPIDAKLQTSENQVPLGAKSVNGVTGGEDHGVSLAIWDVSSPVVEGGLVRLKVGAKCRQGCSLAGMTIEVKNHEGTRLTTGSLGKTPAAGTSALYWTHVEFQPPPMQGLQSWEVLFEKTQVKPLHPEAEGRFSVLFTKPQLCRLTITVADETTKVPLDNAYVRVGDTTLYTDTSGKAVASIPAGEEELVVWKRDHKMSRSKVHVATAGEIHIDLTPYPCKYCPDRTG